MLAGAALLEIHVLQPYTYSLRRSGGGSVFIRRVSNAWAFILWACGVVGYHARLAPTSLREGSGSIPDMSTVFLILTILSTSDRASFVSKE